MLAPLLEPSIESVTYIPPTHSKNTCVGVAGQFESKIKTDVPLGVFPYLCVSIEILVTPCTEKSQRGSLNPAFSANAVKDPPKQLSTCKAILYFRAISPIQHRLLQITCPADNVLAM